MPFAALALLASCSDDKVVDPTVHGPATTAENDLYVTMRINQLGTRADEEEIDTSTGREGEEIGKDRENTIKSALLLFVPWVDGTLGDIGSPANDGKNLIAAHVPESNLNIVGVPGNYAATFNILRTELLNAITANATNNGSVDGTTEWSYKLFFIANPTAAILNKYIDDNGGTTKSPVTLFNTFELNEDTETYWYWSSNKSNFLMSTAEAPETRKLKIADVAPGTHTTEVNALNLGEVKVQRAMSRFDIYVADAEDDPFTLTSNTTPTPGEEENSAPEITVTFEAVALVNQATSANLFKVVGDAPGWNTWINAKNTYKGNNYEWFMDETASNYVYSVDQQTYTRYLFSTQYNTQLAFTNTGFKWDMLSSLNEDDNTYTYPNKTPTTNEDFKIWRYVMENTIRPNGTPVEEPATYDDLSQQAGVSTGVAFRAKMTGTPFPESKTEGKSGIIYAYHNTVAGDFESLLKYNQLSGDIYDGYTNEEQQIATRLAAALENFNKAEKEKASGTYTPKTLTPAEDDTNGVNVITENELKSYLPAVGFTNYVPTEVENNKVVYYCYYVYWNRHNNNGNPAVMGPMEFATVRNNVYKLKVNTVVQLGHPADPNDDPDPIKPDDPDESDLLWCEITCKVLPWSVRINGIDF